MGRRAIHLPSHFDLPKCYNTGACGPPGQILRRNIIALRTRLPMGSAATLCMFHVLERLAGWTSDNRREFFVPSGISKMCRKLHKI